MSNRRSSLSGQARQGRKSSLAGPAQNTRRGSVSGSGKGSGTSKDRARKATMAAVVEVEAASNKEVIVDNTLAPEMKRAMFREARESLRSSRPVETSRQFSTGSRVARLAAVGGAVVAGTHNIHVESNVVSMWKAELREHNRNNLELDRMAEEQQQAEPEEVRSEFEQLSVDCMMDQFELLATSLGALEDRSEAKEVAKSIRALVQDNVASLIALHDASFASAEALIELHKVFSESSDKANELLAKINADMLKIQQLLYGAADDTSSLVPGEVLLENVPGSSTSRPFAKAVEHSLGSLGLLMETLQTGPACEIGPTNQDRFREDLLRILGVGNDSHSRHVDWADHSHVSGSRREREDRKKTLSNSNSAGDGVAVPRGDRKRTTNLSMRWSMSSASSKVDGAAATTDSYPARERQQGFKNTVRRRLMRLMTMTDKKGVSETDDNQQMSNLDVGTEPKDDKDCRRAVRHLATFLLSDDMDLEPFDEQKKFSQWLEENCLVGQHAERMKSVFDTAADFLDYIARNGGVKSQTLCAGMQSCFGASLAKIEDLICCAEDLRAAQVRGNKHKDEQEEENMVRAEVQKSFSEWLEDNCLVGQYMDKMKAEFETIPDFLEYIARNGGMESDTLRAGMQSCWGVPPGEIEDLMYCAEDLQKEHQLAISAARVRARSTLQEMQMARAEFQARSPGEIQAFEERNHALGGDDLCRSREVFYGHSNYRCATMCCTRHGFELDDLRQAEQELMVKIMGASWVLYEPSDIHEFPRNYQQSPRPLEHFCWRSSTHPMTAREDQDTSEDV